jgi:hypothetical protein
VYLEGCPPTEDPRALCSRSSPNFICSHVPMEIFLYYETGKKQGNKKREFTRLDFNDKYLFSIYLSN